MWLWDIWQITFLFMVFKLDRIIFKASSCFKKKFHDSNHVTLLVSLSVSDGSCLGFFFVFISSLLTILCSKKPEECLKCGNPIPFVLPLLYQITGAGYWDCESNLAVLTPECLLSFRLSFFQELCCQVEEAFKKTQAFENVCGLFCL